MMVSGCKFIQKKERTHYILSKKHNFKLNAFIGNYFSKRNVFVPNRYVSLINFETLEINKIGTPTPNLPVLNKVLAKIRG